MSVRDPLGRVAAVRSRREANHLRSELQWSLDNENLSAASEHEIEEALQLLAEQLAPRDAPRARARASAEPDDAAAAPTTSGRGAGGGDRARRGTRPRAGAGGGSSSRTRSRAARVGRSAFRQTGVPAAASDWTRSALQVIGGMVGVSLLYLVLTNAGSRGAGNVPQALQAFAIAFRRFYSPAVDLLGGGPKLSYPDLIAAGVVAGPPRPAGLTAPAPPRPPGSPAGFANYLRLRTGPAAALTGPLRIAPTQSP